MKRKYYLDYLRVLSILLLFPVHTFMIWNNYGQKFYVWGGENRVLSSLIIIVNPWFMPILFVISGICARYSLERRGVKEFVNERIKKLLVPLAAGMVLLVPIQTFYARKFFLQYEGGVIENFKFFYTHLTDFSGYDGCFTPGHLWFILFLFLISIVSLVVFKFIPYDKVSNRISKLSTWKIVSLFFVVWCMYYIGNIGGFSLGKDITLFLLGYYFFSNDEVMEKLKQSSMILLIIFLIFTIVLTISYYNYSYYGDLLVNFVGFIGVCALLAGGEKMLNKETRFINYFNKASFPVYILHQTILVVLGYYTLLYVRNIVGQIVIILCGSFIITILLYEILKRIPFVRVLLGMKY